MNARQTTKHLTLDEMIKLVKTPVLNGEQGDAVSHLKECQLCSEAYEGLKQLPDTTSMHTLTSKWKLKTGPGKTNPLMLNLPALYTFLTLAGLIAIPIVYFFFFDGDSFYKDKKKTQQFQPVIPVSDSLKSSAYREHFVVDDKIIPMDGKEKPRVTITEPKIKEGVYDQLKKPGAPLEKLEPIAAVKEIPAGRLEILKGNSQQKLLNIEGFKIIDYTDEYRKDGHLMQSFSDGLSARYESEKNLEDELKDEKLNTFIVSYEEIIAKALKNYKSGKLNITLDNLNFLMQYFPNDLNCRFYRALCYEESGNYDKAITELQPLVQSNTHTFYEEAKWHLALCYDLSGDHEKSRKLLEEIIEEHGFYKLQAEEKIIDN